MARIRTVKPEFWSHPIMGKLDDATKCLAIALLNFADDYGYFMADPILVRNFCRPFDEDSTNVRRGLETLEKIGWISLKSSENHGTIGLVINFRSHQKIDRPSPSKIEKYFDSTNPRRILDDGSTLERNREQGTGKVKEGNILSGKPDVAESFHWEVLDYLNEKTGKSFRRVTAHASKIKARIREGYTLEDFKKVIDSRVAFWRGKDDFEKYLRPETLFGTKFDSYLAEANPKKEAPRRSAPVSDSAREILEAVRKAGKYD